MAVAACGARRGMDGKTQIEIMGGLVGSLVGITTFSNTIRIWRNDRYQRQVEDQKKRDNDQILAMSETVEHLTAENRRVWERFNALDKDFEKFKRESAERDRVHTVELSEARAELAAAKAEVERNRGQLIFLRREVMAVFAKITAALKRVDPQSELAVTVAAEIAAFVQSVHQELGPLGEAPVIIGNDGAERRLGE